MAEERIRVVVYDEEINALLTKINQAGLGGTGGDEATKRVRELNKQINDARKAAREAGVNLDQLPTLNRDMRVLGQSLPMFRESSRLLFQARRGVRAEQLRRESGSLEELAPELSKQLRLQSLIGYAALISIVVRMIYSAIKGEADRIAKERDTYEAFIMKELNVTRKELQNIAQDQLGYATWFDQLTAEIGNTSLFEAVADFTFARIIEYFNRETYLDEALDLINYSEEIEEARSQSEFDWFLSNTIPDGG